jgi:predicted acetyltransferase
VTTEIRTATEADAETLMRCVRTTFLDPERDDAAYGRFWLEANRPDLDRTWGAFDGATAVGTLRTLPFRLTVPGGATVPADGVTMVTVAPTHRRRGLLTGMMAAGLRAAADRGDAASILIASEWPIYGRYGFGAATEAAEWTVDRRQAQCPPPTGRLELVTAAELRELAPAAYDRARLLRAGGLDRPEPRWDRDFGLRYRDGGTPDWSGRAVVHRDDTGAVDGYLRWHADWKVPFEGADLTVDELVAATPQAHADLWRFALAVDLVVTVTARRRPVDDVLPWLLRDPRAARQTKRYDTVWLRPLDVPAALTARDYPTAGRVVLEVVDPAGYAAGRFALDAGPDGAAVTRTTAAADLTLPVTALGSAYLGGYRLATLAAAGLVDEHRVGAVTRADRLLATDRPPYTPIHF